VLRKELFPETDIGEGNIMVELFPGTCVAPSGEFVYGVHKPRFTALNLRERDHIVALGRSLDGETIRNADNFPDTHIHVEAATWIFEIPNPFPFMGATFIIKAEADRSAEGCNPFRRQTHPCPDGEPPSSVEPGADSVPRGLPQAALLALARASTDPRLLARLADRSCRFCRDENTNLPSGLLYEKTEAGNLRPAIVNRELFDAVSNNAHLPDAYKRQMVLIPGVQGKSPVVGEYLEAHTHVWEYLRENSYIPWGHYAANMAHDAVRYSLDSLSEADMFGLRHLYYQRVYVQLAAELGMTLPAARRCLTRDEVEELRTSLVGEIARRAAKGALRFTGTLWGQNFGCDVSPSGYRLNASHQQIHQQFALVPAAVPACKRGADEWNGHALGTQTQGDLIGQFVREYRARNGRDFFDTYLEAIHDNRRLDNRVDRDSDLVFYQDDRVLAFVPKAQRCQGEVQIMVKPRCGNIIEAGTAIRSSVDRALLFSMKALANLGVEMMTVFELSKRFDNPDVDQRLLYCLLPRHPRSPGSFSEFQQRWITGHYPEDFARSCRIEMERIMDSGSAPGEAARPFGGTP
jgi:hypothetical protein